MKTVVYACAFLLTLPLAGHTQERAAGGNLQTQTTWTALQGLADQANARSKATEAVQSQQIVCGNKRKVYAPGSGSKDAQGCAYADPQTASLTATQNAQIYCANRGKIYATSGSGRDSKGCKYATDNPSTPKTTFKPSGYSKSYAPNKEYKASRDLFVSGYVSGGSSRSACHAMGYVNGDRVAMNYPEHYTGGVSFIVPKGARWKVVLRADHECPSNSKNRVLRVMNLN